MIRHDDLPVVHVLLNTDCNAFELRAPTESPGTCRFCYREPNRVSSTADGVRRIIRELRETTEARRMVFTGGDPLMPHDNHIEVALAEASTVGFETNLHTNGLLLAERYEAIRDHVDIFSLAIDGPDADTADWYRGTGYHAIFWRNVDMLLRDNKRLGLNTFTSGHNVGRLAELAGQVQTIAEQIEVVYWLLSQYRPIGRTNPTKAEIYGYDPAEFRAAVSQARAIATSTEVFDQPTRAIDDPYPLRVWVLGDGEVTIDLGSVEAVRNERVGNGLEEGFDVVLRRGLDARAASAPAHVTASAPGTATAARP